VEYLEPAGTYLPDEHQSERTATSIGKADRRSGFTYLPRLIQINGWSQLDSRPPPAVTELRFLCCCHLTEIRLDSGAGNVLLCRSATIHTIASSA